MSYRFRITNITNALPVPRNIYFTEVGKMLKPGEEGLAHRLHKGREAMVEAREIKVEEGAFETVQNFTPPKPAVKDDEPAEKPTPRVAPVVTELYPSDKKPVAKTTAFDGGKIDGLHGRSSSSSEKVAEAPLVAEDDPDLAKLSVATAPETAPAPREPVTLPGVTAKPHLGGNKPKGR